MRKESQVFEGEIHQVGIKSPNGFQDLVLKYKVGDNEAFASFTAGRALTVHLEPLKAKDIVEVKYNINAKAYKDRFINNLMITNVKMIKEYVPNLFNTSDVNLQDESTFDEFEIDENE